VGYRLTKIYTRTGDTGTTSLGDGQRADKDCASIAAYGELDELNSVLGVLLTQDIPQAIRPQLLEIQHLLFDLGGDLCIPGRLSLTLKQVDWLENALDALNDTLPPLREFVIPGGQPAAAHCHVARAVCRRAERSLVTLAKTGSVSPPALAFINRLSDFLFVLARVLARAACGEEPVWQPERADRPAPADSSASRS